VRESNPLVRKGRLFYRQVPNPVWPTLHKLGAVKGTQTPTHWVEANSAIVKHYNRKKLERQTGLEPVTSSLATKYSAIELLPLIKMVASCGSRTHYNLSAYETDEPPLLDSCVKLGRSDGI
jgi:hypothetical protein